MSILRFKIHQSELIDEMIQFANLHKFDESFVIKNEYTLWLDKHKALIEQEKEFLERHKYKQPLEDKLFKSIKYYYMKKIPHEKKEKKETYDFIPKNIMDSIKHDIYEQLKKDHNFKPKLRFEIFKKSIFMENIQEPKLKKAYKNQYFQIKNK
tara:strand:- start:989 stop:1447 length:459 start_codon:yes stop_codon:yes gene_type:complete